MPKKANKRQKIRLDYLGMMKETIGAGGVSGAEIRQLMPALKKAALSVKQKRDDGMLGFMLLPYDAKGRDEIKKAAERIRRDFENLVVIGAGGSSVSSLALHGAIKHPFYNILPAEKRKAPRLFVIEGNDPETLNGLIELLDLRKTCVNFISKSGATASTAVMVKIIMKKMSACGPSAIKENLIITTSRQSGALRMLAAKYGITVFGLPENVSSRFSVLSPAGLLAAAACGVNIDEILKGAAYMDSIISGAEVLKNPAYMMAALRFISDRKFGRKTSVVVPYSDPLKSVCEWYAGLIAGATAREMEKDGRRIKAGITPLVAPAPASHHSMAQLIAEGPPDKVVTFLRVSNPGHDQNIPKEFAETAEFLVLGGKKNKEIIDLQYIGFRDELISSCKPSMTVTLPELTEFTLGQLIYMLESEAVFLAELYNIDAFRQPASDRIETALYRRLGINGAAKRNVAVKAKKSLKYTI